MESILLDIFYDNTIVISQNRRITCNIDKWTLKTYPITQSIS